MSLNPLTLLEKAINEHGSAAILKERIELARDEHSSLERKLTDATKLISQYESTIKQLQSENGRLHENLQQHETKIQALESRLNPTHNTLHENERKILKCLAGCDHATTDELAENSTLGKQTVKMHLAALEELELVEHFHSYLTNPYRLTDNGRKLMFDLGQLN